MNVFCIVTQNHDRSVVALGHIRNFKRHLVDSGYNLKNGGILIQGRGNYCLKLKKGKCTTKKLFKLLNEETRFSDALFSKSPFMFMFTTMQTRLDKTLLNRPSST